MKTKWLGFVLVGTIAGCGAIQDVQNGLKETAAKIEGAQKLKSLGSLMGASQASTKAEMPDRSTSSTSPAPSFMAAAADKACVKANRDSCLDAKSNTCKIGVVWNACPDIDGAAHFSATTTPTSADFAVQFTNTTIGTGSAKVNVNGTVTLGLTNTGKKLDTLTITDGSTYKFNDPLSGDKTITPASSFSWKAATQVLNFSAKYNEVGKDYTVALENLTFADACDSAISGKVTLTEGAESFVFNITACGKGTYTNKDGTYDVDGSELIVLKGFRPGKKIFNVQFE